MLTLGENFFVGCIEVEMYLTFQLPAAFLTYQRFPQWPRCFQCKQKLKANHNSLWEVHLYCQTYMFYPLLKLATWQHMIYQGYLKPPDCIQDFIIIFIYI